MFLSALARPEDRWWYGKHSTNRPDLFDLAAAYAFGLSKNHSFIDGNKRTGAATAILFLRANGIELDIDQQTLVKALVSLVNNKITEETLARWFRQRQVGRAVKLDLYRLRRSRKIREGKQK